MLTLEQFVSRFVIVELHNFIIVLAFNNMKLEHPNKAMISASWGVTYQILKHGSRFFLA